MHHRDDLKTARERAVAREVMKLELRQARQHSAGRAEGPGTVPRDERAAERHLVEGPQEVSL